MFLRMSFKQLFIANFKILIRSWRGLFWNIFFPLALYVGLSSIGRGQNTIGVGGARLLYSSYLLPGMIALTIMQTGIFGLSYWLIDLKERGVIKRFRVTPLSNTELVASLVATRLIVMFVQIILLTSIGAIFFHAKITGNIFAIILFTILGGSFFLTLGFLISTMARTYDEATPITTVLNLIFTFLGNVFFPTQVFPKLLKIVGNIIPLTYLADGMRKNFIGNAKFLDSTKDLLALVIWLVIVGFITLRAFKRQEQD